MNLFRLSLLLKQYTGAQFKHSINLSCKSNKLFLYEGNIGFKWDMIYTVLLSKNI